MKNIKLSYLSEKKVNPIFIETKRQKWEKHLPERKNLYENYLKLPFRV